VGVEIAIFTAVIVGVCAGLMLENYRRRSEPEIAGPAPGKVAPLRLTGPGTAWPGGVVDGAAGLRLVSDAGFASKPLLSGREADALGFVEAATAEAGQGWRVVPQVRLVDILASSDAEANAVIGEQRLDMLIVSASHLPVAALDYQPLGQMRDDSALRDAIKREALRRADIPFIEIRANEPLDAVKAQILRLAAAPMPVKAVRVRAPAKTVAAKAITVKAVSKKASAAPSAPAKADAVKPAPAKAAAAPKPVAKAGKPAATKAAPAKAAPAKAAVAPPVATVVTAVPAPAKPAAAKLAAKPAASKPAAKPAAKTAAKTVAAKAKPAPKSAAKPSPKDPPAKP
jgi:hypothetical protein